MSLIPHTTLFALNIHLSPTSSFLLRSSSPYLTLARSLCFNSSIRFLSSDMPKKQKKKAHVEHKWQVKPKMDAEAVNNQFGGLSLAESNTNVPVLPSQTTSSSGDAKVGLNLSKIFGGDLLEKFSVDKSTYCHAQIRATFYPKFENEKTDQEIRTRMIEMVSKGLATLEVSLKHSGSLFMYAGHKGGAYAKNSFGNIYTAVGVFVLSRMFREAWGTKSLEKEEEFNDFLEKNRMCISMELVTAVLGDHGQRPLDDYVVVTAVTELGNGKPKFYSTSEIIAFCRKWRLPTNHVWLFSTRKSVTSFFAAFDALCEEGIATSVCRALDEVADISVPASKDHVKVQGEILEGLVARIVSSQSARDMENVLRDHPPPPCDGADLDLGLSLREICAAHRSNEKQQMRALLRSVGPSFCPSEVDWFGDESHPKNADKSVITKFLQSQPADYSTSKLQEMVRLMKEKRLPAAFKCYHNFHRADDISPDNLFYKLVVHVHSDSGFRRYQKEMRHMPSLWPLYRGFFVDINLFKSNKGRDLMALKSIDNAVKDASENDGQREKDGLADGDANLMIKLKFLTYKLRTFLIRNGLSILFKEGPAAYKTYYLRQMKIWGTSDGKQKELCKMLDEWAAYIRRKCGNDQLSSSTYLSEAEPFLEQYAKRSPKNQILIGSAGNLVRTEDFLAIVDGDLDEEGDLVKKERVTPATPEPAVKEAVQKDEGLIVFFPGIPGCAKSALCKELLNAPGGFGDDRPVHTLMGDLVKGKYWPKVADERRKKPQSIMLADKNAPNEDVWRQIEDMCRRTRASAVPIVADSEGTDTNPYSLDALAVFMFRVLQRVNHPGKLDKESSNAGYVLLMFYHLYEGKNRNEFESELIERFGSLIKMPLLKSDRTPLPGPVKSVLEEGIDLFNLHSRRHGRLESTKGTYAAEWTKWEKQLRDTLVANSEYLNSIQVPFESVVHLVREELKKIAKGEYKPPSSEKTKHGSIVFAAINLPATQVHSLLEKLAASSPTMRSFLEGKKKTIQEKLERSHVTLAHKRSHGVAAVASYGQHLNREIPVELTELIYNDKMAALTANVGCVDGETVVSKNEWPHVTLWTAEGVTAKEANTLPQLYLEGKASRLVIDPPVSISGPLEFF
ncbi:tRNA ligase phosphodiesterase [Arabidopsis suecica]|uniref:tRNA ligase phosphodiesterase n=2 Tax=Arabidopsis suecica TaxID=45249 RepID=A0A8T2H231_ARASU|nr:tRNA ligase phosphodiesterase [Arabidopsis suecica]